MPTQSDTYSFTTGSSPVIDSISPADGITHNGNSIELSATVTDPDGDQIQVGFFNAADDTLISPAQTINSGETASITWKNLSVGTYEWYAKALDPNMNEAQSETRSFTIEYITMICYRTIS